MRNLPQPVVNRALANGVAGRDWLNQLDSLIADLESLWHISVGDALSGGTAAFVAPAGGKRGRRCVLRIDMPGDSSFDNAVHALELADGRGYVRLIASDAQRHACLLERLGAPLRVLNAPVDQQLDILCDSLNHAWLPISGANLPGCAESIAWFRDFIPKVWQTLNRPCPRSIIDRALEFLDERAAYDRPAEHVLVHGDANSANLLQVPGQPGEFRFIDPDGLCYEKAYDLGVLMREWVDEYRSAPVRAGQERCAHLHHRTGVDPRAIWQWGYLQSVSTGLVCMQIHYDDHTGDLLLQLADAWRAVQPPHL